MIGYDLDGVLGPDIIIKGNLGELLRIRDQNLKPLFNPPGEWVLITGRPIEDRKSTTKWILDNFENPPVKIYHKNESLDTAAEYKASVINKIPDLRLFIESDESQVEYLTQNTIVKIIHYSTMMEDILKELQKGL